jgi:hypothetical protein
MLNIHIVSRTAPPLFLYFSVPNGLAVAQAVSRRPLTAEATGSISSQSMWDLWWTLVQYFGFPCQYHSTNAPYSSSFTRRSYKKDERAKYGILPKGIGNRRVFWHSLERVGLEIVAFWSLSACQGQHACCVLPTLVSRLCVFNTPIASAVRTASQPVLTR